MFLATLWGGGDLLIEGQKPPLAKWPLGPLSGGRGLWSPLESWGGQKVETGGGGETVGNFGVRFGWSEGFLQWWKNGLARKVPEVEAVLLLQAAKEVESLSFPPSLFALFPPVRLMFVFF